MKNNVYYIIVNKKLTGQNKYYITDVQIEFG